MVVRGAEYGNDRILVGAHYAMDVIGGRTLALYDAAHPLADDPAYAKADFKAAILAARADMVAALAAASSTTARHSAIEIPMNDIFRKP